MTLMGMSNILNLRVNTGQIIYLSISYVKPAVLRTKLSVFWDSAEENQKILKIHALTYPCQHGP